MPGVVNGQNVDQTVTNNAFIFKTGSDTFTADLEAASVTPAAGGSIDNIQQEHNSVASFVGKATNTAANATPTYTNNQGFTAGEDLRDRTDAISAKFHNTTGHAHTGAAGDAPAIPFSALTGSITNAQLDDMAQSTIKGRAAGSGTGDPQDLTATQATAILDVFTSLLKGLAPASGGGTTNFLRADGTWAAPTVSGSTLTLATKTANYTLTNSDDVIIYNATSNVTLTLHASSGATSKVFRVKNIGTGDLTIVVTGGDTIDGDTSLILPAGGSPQAAVELIPNGGTAWYVF